jgi:hypothetical protein
MATSRLQAVLSSGSELLEKNTEKPLLFWWHFQFCCSVLSCLLILTFQSPQIIINSLETKLKRENSSKEVKD